MVEQKFFVLANLVKQHPVEDLVAQLKSRKIISKEQVIRESKYCPLPVRMHGILNKCQ